MSQRILNLTQQQDDASPKWGGLNQKKAGKSKDALEADGIKLIDCEVSDDLRKSIGFENLAAKESKERNNVFDDSVYLLQELEKVKLERDEVRRQKEQIIRDHMNQTFESNLDIKEENYLLKEQDIVRNELLNNLEKKNDQLESEVSY